MEKIFMNNASSNLDIQAALELLGGEEDLYKELLLAYIAALPKDINQLYDLEKDSSLNEAAKFVHRLKGSSLQIGATEFGKTAQELEDLLRNKQQGNIQELTQRFIKQYEELVQEVKAMVEK